MTAALAAQVDACFSEEMERLVRLEDLCVRIRRGEHVHVEEVVTVRPIRRSTETTKEP